MDLAVRVVLWAMAAYGAIYGWRLVADAAGVDVAAGVVIMILAHRLAVQLTQKPATSDPPT